MAMPVETVIRPAAYCGIAGYKPSYKLLPTIGIWLISEAAGAAGCKADFTAACRIGPLSLGGAIALELAVCRPELVRRLVLCAPAGFSPTSRPLPQGQMGMIEVSGPSVFPGYLGHDGPPPARETVTRTATGAHR